MPRVKLPNGEYVQFPDGTPNSTMESAIKSYLTPTTAEGFDVPVKKSTTPLGTTGVLKPQIQPWQVPVTDRFAYSKTSVRGGEPLAESKVVRDFPEGGKYNPHNNPSHPMAVTDIGGVKRPMPEGDYYIDADGVKRQREYSAGENFISVVGRTAGQAYQGIKSIIPKQELGQVRNQLNEYEATGKITVGYGEDAVSYVPTKEQVAELRKTQVGKLGELNTIKSDVEASNLNFPKSLARQKLDLELQNAPKTDSWFGGAVDTAKTLATNPLSSVGLLAESSGSAVPIMAISALTRNPYALAAINGFGGFSQEQGMGVVDYLTQNGYRIEDYQNIPDNVIDDAIAYTNNRSWVVGGGTALLGGLAGKSFVKPTMTGSMSSNVLKNAGAQAAIGTVGDGAFETLAQVASGQPLSPQDTILEMAGGGLSQPIEATQAILESAKMSGMNYTDVASDEQLAEVARNPETNKETALTALMELMNRGKSVDEKGNLVNGVPTPTPKATVTPLGEVGQEIEQGAGIVAGDPVVPPQEPTEPVEPIQPVAQTPPTQVPTQPVELGGLINQLFGAPKGEEQTVLQGEGTGSPLSEPVAPPAVQPLGGAQAPVSQAPNPNDKTLTKDGIPKTPLTRKSSDGLNKLRTKLKMWAARGSIRNGKGNTIAPSNIDVSEIERTELPVALATAMKVSEKAFNTPVVLYRKEGKSRQLGLGFNGITTKSGNAIYVDSEGSHPIVSIMFHEFTHQLSGQENALYQRLADYVRKNGDIGQHAKDRGYTGLGQEGRIEELVADLTGDAMNDPDFLRKLAKKDPTLFGELAEKLIDYIDNFIAKLGLTGQNKSYGSNKYISDVLEFREILADTLVEYGKAQKGKTTPISSKPSGKDNAPIMSVDDIEKPSDNRGSLKPFAQQGEIEIDEPMFSNEEDSEPLMSHTPNTKLDDAKSFVATIESVRSRAFDSLVSRADALRKDVPQLDAIFKKIFIFAGGKNVGVKNVIESAEQIRTIFHNEVEKAIEGAFGHNKDLNEQENNELRQAILGFPVANQAVQRAGQRISDLMKQTRDRAEAAGIPIGEVTDIGYLPRVYKTHEIQKNKEGFLRDATRLFHDHEFELEVGDASQTYTNKKMLSKYIALMRLYGLTDPTVKSAVNVVKDQMRIIKGTKDQATRIAAFQEIINQMNAVRPIIQQKYAETRANAWFIGMGMRSMRDYVNVVPDQKARPTKDRMLSGAADTVMKDWLDVDVRELMSGYAGVMSRKISASEAFGKDPMKSVDNILNGIRRRGEMTEAQFDEAQALISSAMGWKDRPHDGVVRNTLDAVATLATLGLLEQATFTSLAEPITTTIRTGNLKHLALPLRQLATALVRSRVKDRDVAYAIGLIARNAASAVSLHRVGVMEADYSRWSSKTLTRFFTLNMLTQLTNDQRLLAMRVGAEEFKRLAKKALRGNVMANDFMKEHGITDIQAFSDWIEAIRGIPQEADIYGADGAMTPMGQIYADAVHRFVNGSIQNPNATLKPAWASDPKLRLLSGIMSFAYAIYENLIKRELRILREGTASEGATRMATVFAPTMVALVVSQIAISALRMILNGDDPEDEEFMEKAIQRGTLNVVSFGVSGQTLNFVTGYKYASTASETLIGAYPSYFAKGMDLVMKSFSDRNSDNTETAENAKGKGIYDLVVAPIVLAGATYLPAGYKWFSRLAIAIESHKQTREKFAEMFGIPPERENATDKAYSEKIKGSEKAVEMVTAKVKGTDKAQWDEQFEAMKKEFPELLEGYEFVTYADNSENRKKGRAGEQQTTPSGKVKLQNKNLDEVDDEKKVITSLNKSLKTVRTTSDLTYAGLKDAVTIDEKSYSPVADKMLADIAEEDMDDEIGRANRIKVIKDLEEQRTEVKKKAILDLK